MVRIITAECKILQHRITTKQGHTHYSAKVWSLPHKVTAGARFLKNGDSTLFSASAYISIRKIVKNLHLQKKIPFYSLHKKSHIVI